MRSNIILSFLGIMISINLISCASTFAEQYQQCVYTFCQSNAECYNQAVEQLVCAVNLCKSITSDSLFFDCIKTSYDSQCEVSNEDAERARCFCLKSLKIQDDCVVTASSSSLISASFVMLSMIISFLV